MVVVSPVKSRRVWVESGFKEWPNCAIVNDVHGRQHELLTGGPWCFYEATDGRCMLGAAASWMGEVGDGVHRVRFRGGKELLVRLDSPHQWESPS